MTKITVSTWKQRRYSISSLNTHNNSVTIIERKIIKKGFFKVRIGNYRLQENSNDDGVRIATCATSKNPIVKSTVSSINQQMYIHMYL